MFACIWRYRLGLILGLTLFGSSAAWADDSADLNAAIEKAKTTEAALGPDHADLATVLSNVARMYAAQGQPTLAADDFDRARRIARKHVMKTLSKLSESEQLTFLQDKDHADFQAALSLGLMKSDDAEIAARSASWLANGKAVAFESLAQRAEMERATADPKVREIVVQLDHIRVQLASAINNTSPFGSMAARAVEVERLNKQEQSLSKQLAAAFPAAPVEWIELDQIRHNIPKDAILVDVLRMRPADFTTSTENLFRGPHYVVWLTPAAGHGNVAMVDLGSAYAIDAAVTKYQTAMRTSQTFDKNVNPLMSEGEAEAEKQLLTSLGEISKLVLQPLMSHLKDKQELIVSPDANLWLVPWAALPVPHDEAGATVAQPGKDAPGEYAVEKWNIHYVTAARELATENRKSSVNPPRVFANPNFDLSVAEMPKVLAGIFGGGKPTTPAAAKSDDDLADLAALNHDLHSRAPGTIDKVPPLPSTAAEAAAIIPNLKKYTQSEPKLYSDNSALEGVFKRLKSPRVLAIMTHGFQHGDQSIKMGEINQELLKGIKVPDEEVTVNPLLHCGLLLAGCNNRDKLPKDSPLDDGVLTGMEITGVDLRGTELVVLSANDTALGKVVNGEGVVGVRQAFQLAGAQSVVAALWQLPDVATARLMDDFFANLATGQSKSESLRNAQLKAIKTRREKYGAAHPLFWAAFTLTGQ